MAIYAIGDVQGCYDSLRRLLDKIEFDERRDELWFTGDLVNRGPASLKTLRFVRSLGASAITVLGNHDLHLLAAHLTTVNRRSSKDTLDEVLRAKDCEELLHWLRQRPFIHGDERINTVMIHAGLAPDWSIAKHFKQAKKLEAILRSDEAAKLLKLMYGVTPRVWSAALSYWQRRQYALAVFTRLRYVDNKGRLEMSQKGAPGNHLPHTRPWFNAKHPRWEEQARIVFGHWSTLDRTRRDDVIALDGGCVWGGCLMAVRLSRKKAPKFTLVKCRATATP